MADQLDSATPNVQSIEVAGQPINNRRAAILYEIWKAEGSGDPFLVQGLTVPELHKLLQPTFSEITLEGVRTHLYRLASRLPNVLGVTEVDLRQENEAGNALQRYPLVGLSKIIRRKLTAQIVLKALVNGKTRVPKEQFILECCEEFKLERGGRTGVDFRVSQLLNMHYLSQEHPLDHGPLELFADRRTNAELLFILHLAKHESPPPRYL